MNIGLLPPLITHLMVRHEFELLAEDTDLATIVAADKELLAVRVSNAAHGCAVVQRHDRLGGECGGIP